MRQAHPSVPCCGRCNTKHFELHQMFLPALPDANHALGLYTGLLWVGILKSTIISLLRHELVESVPPGTLHDNNSGCAPARRTRPSWSGTCGPWRPLLMVCPP